MSWFRHLAALEAVAQEGHEPEIERGLQQISRRRLLQGTAAAALAAAISSVAVPAKPVRAARAPRIAIVGAGIAGLTAALRLADRGLSSTVYEATGRVGGRMRSNTSGYWQSGQVSEWCGELIDTNHVTVRGLAKRYGLILDDLLAAEASRAQDTYFFLGKHYRAAQAAEDFGAIYAAVKHDVHAAGYPTRYNKSTAAGRALDQMTAYEWIEKRVPGGHQSRMGALLDVAYNTEYAAETTDQPALNILYLLGFGSSPNNFHLFGESDERFHIRGGNQQLPQQMRDDIEGRGVQIAHGMRMTQIARSAQTGRMPCPSPVALPT